MKYLLITLGLIFAVVGFIGIVVPLLPTTPFYYWPRCVFPEVRKVQSLAGQHEDLR